MLPTPARGWFITGTDTGVGKTCTTLAMLRWLQGRRIRCNAMKPIASGCMISASGQAQNEDARQLQAASDPCPAYQLVNPYALLQASAPALAAAQEHRNITLPVIQNAFNQLQNQADWTLVEGIGGWRVPLSSQLEMRDIVQALHLPVILVVPLRLGCINHALLTHDSLQQHPFAVVGWVLNHIEATPSAQLNDYPAALQQALHPLPCLGKISYHSHPEQACFIAHPTAEQLLLHTIPTRL